MILQLKALLVSWFFVKFKNQYINAMWILCILIHFNFQDMNGLCSSFDSLYTIVAEVWRVAYWLKNENAREWSKMVN